MAFVAAELAGTESAGIDTWMTRVAQQCELSRRGFDPETVHDLRVALRRCRSIADGFMTLDPHPVWKQMKNEGKRLFQQLGALRDTHVMQEWVLRIAPVPDEASILLNNRLAEQEIRLKEGASEALGDFDHRKWASWIRLLSGRARRIPPGSIVYRHIALERWCAVRELQRQALRNRSDSAYHRLRIGLKKFRYTLENFLPSLHASWGEELREIQGLLGDMHDLNALSQTARAIGALRAGETRLRWRAHIAQERDLRLEKYRAMMVGDNSRILVWRSALPQGDQIPAAALARLRGWASFRDPDCTHSEYVAKLALQIYDGLESLDLTPGAGAGARELLEAAAVLHNVGAGEGRKKWQILSSRLIRKLKPPLGWNEQQIRDTALVVRFHRGALPRSDQGAFAGLSAQNRSTVLLLSGILRLANAFDSLHQKRIRRLRLKRIGTVLHIAAAGYSPADAAAEKVAAARHLLEVVCGMPILIE